MFVFFCKYVPSWIFNDYFQNNFFIRPFTLYSFVNFSTAFTKLLMFIDPKILLYVDTYIESAGTFK